MVASKADQLPQARKIQIANFELDAYYNSRSDTYYFSATQIAKTFSDSKAGGVQFLNSRRAEPILEALSELRVGVQEFAGIDSKGNQQRIKGLSEVDAILYIIDIFRKKPSPKIQLFLSILAVDSLRRFCDYEFGIKRSESEHRAKDKLLFKTLNQRKDCDVVDRDAACNLLTSTELAVYLNLPVNSKNTHKFAFWMREYFPGSDRILSRRLYDVDSRKVRAIAARYFELEALHQIQFEKQSNPNAFDDELIESFGDM